MRGKIYILTNDAMPDYVKIGFTTLDDVRGRMKQLDTTGLPLPFRLYACIEVDNVKDLEQLAHAIFASQRARKTREFFMLEAETAYQYLRAISLNDPTARWVSSDQEMVDEDGRSLPENQAVKPRLESFTFGAAEVPIGAEIQFVRDATFRAEVVSQTQVRFEGELYKLSPLTRLLFERLGLANPSGAYQGAKYFTYEDELLADRRRRLNEEPAEE